MILEIFMRWVVGLAITVTTVSTGQAAEITVFAASSLTDALREFAAAHQKESGDRVVFNFAASSVLARQIEEGAPADLFFSADEARMDHLAAKDLIVPATRTNLLSNVLVVVVPADRPLQVAEPADLAGVRFLALGEPRSVPAGVYARQYLESHQLWKKLHGKVVPTESVRAALAAVEAGNADAAIVYRTDAAISRKVRIAYHVPAGEGPRILYPVALLREAPQPEAARRFLAGLASAPAAAVFRRHGFIVLSQTPDR